MSCRPISAPRCDKQLDDGFVGLEDGKAFIFRQAVAQRPALSTLHIWLSHTGASVEVIDAVRGRGMDGACALVGGDVVGQHAQDATIEERVPKVTRSSLDPLKRAISFASFKPAGLPRGCRPAPSATI